MKMYLFRLVPLCVLFTVSASSLRAQGNGQRVATDWLSRIEAQIHQHGTADSLLLYKAIAQSIHEKDTATLAELLFYQAKSLRAQQRLSAAQGSYARAIDLFRYLANPVGQARCHINTGWIHYLESRYDSSLVHYRASESLLQNGSAYRLQGITALNMGLVYQFRGQLDTAARAFNRALDRFEITQDSSNIVKAWNNLGLVYGELELYADSERYFRRVLAVAESASWQDLAASAYINLGNLAFKQQQYQRAKAYYQRIDSERQRAAVQSSLWLNLGLCWLRTSAPDSAYTYLHRAYAAKMQQQDRKGESIAAGALSAWHLAYQSADSSHWYATQQLHSAEALGSWSLQADAYLQLAQAQEARGELAAALRHRTTSAALSERVRHPDITLTVAEAAYARSKKETLVNWTAQLQQRIRQQWKIMVVVMLGALAVLFIALRRIRQYRLSIVRATRDKQVLQNDVTTAREAIEQQAVYQSVLQQQVANQQQDIQAAQIALQEQQRVVAELEQLLQAAQSAPLTQGMSVEQLVDWSLLRQRLQQTRPDFFQALLQLESSLSPTDLKHCLYVHTGMAVGEVAQMLFISSKTVETARYRVKKKLQLDKHTSLYAFLNSVTLAPR